MAVLDRLIAKDALADPVAVRLDADDFPELFQEPGRDSHQSASVDAQEEGLAAH
jgi:hypothetical protein